MSIKSLQSLAVRVIDVAQVMKAECTEKEVISRMFIESLRENELKDNKSDGSLFQFTSDGSSLFLRTLIAAENHPCMMKQFKVWHGNWKMTRNGHRVERKPLTFRNRSICRCRCDKRGKLCECRCAAIIKMAAEFKVRSVYFDRKKPMLKFRIDQMMQISDLLKE